MKKNRYDPDAVHNVRIAYEIIGLKHGRLRKIRYKWRPTLAEADYEVERMNAMTEIKGKRNGNVEYIARIYKAEIVEILWSLSWKH